ncbi:type II toxin-antitoxin system death-on-curing family toxin [Lactobacillaceae bacterium Melli_B4]
MIYLTKDDIIHIHQNIMDDYSNHEGHVQYEQGLDLVIEQPKMVLYGHELYPTLFDKAAYMLQKVTKKHIFDDGNKRTAYHVAYLFLALNNYLLDLNDDQIIKLMLSVTNSPDSQEVMQLISRKLKQYSHYDVLLCQ